MVGFPDIHGRPEPEPPDCDECWNRDDENERLQAQVEAMAAAQIRRTTTATNLWNREHSRAEKAERKNETLTRALGKADRLADTCTSSLNNETGFTTLVFSRTALDKYRAARSGGGEGG